MLNLKLNGVKVNLKKIETNVYFFHLGVIECAVFSRLNGYNQRDPLHSTIPTPKFYLVLLATLNFDSILLRDRKFSP